MISVRRAFRLPSRNNVNSTFLRVLSQSIHGAIPPNNRTSKTQQQDIVKASKSSSGFDLRFYFSSPFTHWSFRCFHITRVVQGKRKQKPQSPVFKHERKTVRVKRYKPAPVETQYVAPIPKRDVKSPAKVFDIFDGMTLAELAERAGESVGRLQEVLLSIGEHVSLEFQPITMDVAELIAMELNTDVRRVHIEKGAKLEPRPAVITVMGHVDHGKTSLLDALRQTSVAAKEAGGITQHLGAFVVKMSSGASLTFLDTPGHAAFSAMRARGAAVTDIVVLVVAADDGVMPQTREAMAHAQAAKVPIVVAINKCDKEDANPEQVKFQLASEGLALEEMGGDVQAVEISAVTKLGLDKLEEALVLQAELMDLKSRTDGHGHAYVVESRVDRGRGPLVTAIVRSGKLVPGLHIVVGCEWGKIRVLRDMSGKPIQSAGPSIPVEIEGLRGLPLAGDEVNVVFSEERARKLSTGRKIRMEELRLTKQGKEIVAPLENPEEGGNFVEMPIIVKGDMQGTAQAVADSLKTLNSAQVHVSIIYTGVGAVSQADVDMAAACGACIVGFNLKNTPGVVQAAARQAKVDIRHHRVIYHLLEDIGKLIVEKAPGIFEIEVVGEAEVLKVFEVKVKGRQVAKIAGCKVVEGRISKTSKFRVLRSGDVVFEGNCQSMRREKQDVDAVGKDTECGVGFQDWDDLQEGDVIQCIEQLVRKPKFVSANDGVVRIEC